MQITELIVYAGSLCVGIGIGYYYGLSLMKQEKALSTTFILPLVRLTLIALLGLLFLHWGIIPFILFIASLLTTMWTTIFIQTR